METITEDELKKCSKCEETFPATLDFFYKQKINTKNGVGYKLTSYCKECQKKQSNKWISGNRERHNETQLKYFRTEKGRNTRYPEKEKQRLRKWQIENPERIKGYSEKRSQNKTHNISTKEWEECKKYFNHRCAYCELKIECHFIQHRGKTILGDFHREHLIHDGENDLSNCVPSCKSCNSSKGESKFEEWHRFNEDITLESKMKIYTWINYDYKKFKEELK